MNDINPGPQRPETGLPTGSHPDGHDTTVPVEVSRTRLVLILLSLAVFVTITYEILPIGLLTPIAAQLHVNEQGAGLLIGSYAIVVAIGSIPLSALVARFDPRATLLILLGVLALSSSLLAASTTLPIAVLARLIGGAAHAVILTTVYRLALAIVPIHRRGRAASAVAIGNGAALALGVPLTTALGAATTWRVPFIVVAGSFIATAALAALLVPGHLGNTGQHLSTRILLDAVRQPPLLRVGITVLALCTAHFATYTYIEPILLQTGVTPAGISAVLLGYGIAGIAALLIVTPLTDRHPRTLAIATMALIVTALATLLLGHNNVPISVAAVIIWGLALGAFPVLVQVLAIRASHQVPAAAAPMVNSTFNIGITTGSAIGGLILATTNSTTLVLASIATAALITGISAHRRWLPPDRTP